MDHKELLLRINTKQAELDIIKTELKELFFGIDHQIDKIVEYIKAWYITPEIITRPLIINLWGLTGVGKTSLIRELVKRLNFTNKFVEIQMGDNPTGYHNSNISSILKQSSIDENEPGIVLLDEFQRFRTIDQDKSDIQDLKFQDIWMLLSDGKFAKDYSLFEKIMDFSDYNLIDYEETDIDEAPSTKTKKKKTKEKDFKDRKLGRWQLRALKVLLGNYCTMDELRAKTIEEIETTIQTYLESDSNNAIDYSKCLIFVSGNLDEAYNMSDSVEDCDTDADIFHQITSGIGITDIKRALSNRFKPEQIARLGNNHIIYPSLTKAAYNKIIDVSCQNLVRDAEQIAGIKFNIKNSVINEIYENSVYPSQGTRPVFSSIHKMLAAPLTDGLFWGLSNGLSELDINISSKKSAIVFSNGRQNINVPIDFDVRDKKNQYTNNYTSLLAVHESGHALAYALLFKQPPKQIKINVASFNGGFTFSDFKVPTKESILDKICVFHAGAVAEEIVFGKANRSNGNESDLANATSTAARFIRALGLGDRDSYHLTTDKALYNEDIDSTNAQVEMLVTQMKIKTQQLLNANKQLLLRLSKMLFDEKEINPEEFIKEFKNDIELNLLATDNKFDTHANYYDLLSKAIEQNV